MVFTKMLQTKAAINTTHAMRNNFILLFQMKYNADRFSN